MAKFAIGQFEFINLSQAPIPPKDKIAVHSRAGVEGVELRRTGKRGEPFTVQTVMDAADYSAALALYKEYLTLIDGDPVDLMFLDETEPNKVQVLDVQPIPGGVTAILFGLNGMSGEATPSYGWCACEWTLIEITEAEEEEQ